MNNNEFTHSLDTFGTQSPAYTRAELERMFLPVKQMLQLDRVKEIRNILAVCEIDVANHWVFPMHFPGDSIFPGSLLIEAAGQAVAVWAWHMGFRGRPRLVRVSAKFDEPILPDDRTVTVEASVRRRQNVFVGTVRLAVGKKVVAMVEPTLVLVPI